MPLEQIPLPIPQWRDVLEILLVAYVVYRLLRFLAGTRALQILLGLLVLAVIYVAALLLKLTMITYLLGVVFTYGAFAALIVFQPELRQALARLGQSRVFRLFGGTALPVVAEEIAEAVDRLSRNATGAIIAIERDIRLDEYLDSGTRMRATVSADLLATIFSPYSPLHDGAVTGPWRPDRGRRLYPAAHAGSRCRPLARNAASRRGGPVRGDRRTRARRLRGNGDDLARRRGSLRRGLTTESVRVLLVGVPE